MVRLQPKRTNSQKPGTERFNSIMVRLQRSVPLAPKEGTVRFQFHHGTITTMEALIRQYNNHPRFNSIMVRLQLNLSL